VLYKSTCSSEKDGFGEAVIVLDRGLLQVRSSDS
jgi:hypothetical protein